MQYTTHLHGFAPLRLTAESEGAAATNAFRYYVRAELRGVQDGDQYLVIPSEVHTVLVEDEDGYATTHRRQYVPNEVGVAYVIDPDQYRVPFAELPLGATFRLDAADAYARDWHVPLYRKRTSSYFVAVPRGQEVGVAHDSRFLHFDVYALPVANVTPTR